jgi:hypothetical protein
MSKQLQTGHTFLGQANRFIDLIAMSGGLKYSSPVFSSSLSLADFWLTYAKTANCRADGHR